MAVGWVYPRILAFVPPLSPWTFRQYRAWSDKSYWHVPQPNRLQRRCVAERKWSASRLYGVKFEPLLGYSLYAGLTSRTTGGSTEPPLSWLVVLLCNSRQWEDIRTWFSRPFWLLTVLPHAHWILSRWVSSELGSAGGLEPVGDCIVWTWRRDLRVCYSIAPVVANNLPQLHWICFPVVDMFDRTITSSTQRKKNKVAHKSYI